MTPEERADKALLQYHDSILCWIDGPERYGSIAGPQTVHATYELWLTAARRTNPALDYLVRCGNTDWAAIRSNLIDYYRTLPPKKSWWERLKEMFS